MQHMFEAAPREIYARTRNGDVKARGIEVLGGADMSTVYLSNINSKGLISNGWAALPMERAALLAVAAELTRLAESADVASNEKIKALEALDT